MRVIETTRSTVRVDTADRTRDPHAYPGAAPAAFYLVLLVLTCLIAFIDGQIFALLLPPIKAALGISDTRIGLIQGTGPSLATGLVSLPLALFIDRGDRTRLVLLGVAGWSAFSILSGFANGFWQLLICRTGVGVCTAGLYPLAFSLIADLYPPGRRDHATLVFFGAILVTASASIAVGGTTVGLIDAHAHELPWDLAGRVPWRLSFIAAGLPGLLLAALFLTVQEPSRKHDAAATSLRQRQDGLGAFARANGWTILRISASLSLSPGIFILLLFWMPTLLNRRYGMPAEHAGQLLGLTIGVGSVSGTLIAAGLNILLRRLKVGLAPLRVLQVGTLAATAFAPAMFLTGGLTEFLTAWTAFVALTYIASSIGPVLWLNVIPNQLRGRVAALGGFTDVVVTSLTMPAVGALSDRVFRGSDGLLEATAVAGLPCCLAALLLVTKLKQPILRMTSLAPAEPAAPAEPLPFPITP